MEPFLNRSILSIEGTLTDPTILGLSGPGSNGKEEVLHTITFPVQNGSSSVQNENSSVQNGKIIISINIKTLPRDNMGVQS